MLWIGYSGRLPEMYRSEEQDCSNDQAQYGYAQEFVVTLRKFKSSSKLFYKHILRTKMSTKLNQNLGDGPTETDRETAEALNLHIL